MEEVSGIILSTTCENIGNTADVEILGKTCHEWVKTALGEHYTATVPYDGITELPLVVRRHINPISKLTVILFSDTPLISKKTVLDAINYMENSDKLVLKMTRGFVVRTRLLLTSDKLPYEDTHFFDEEDFVTVFDYRQVAYVSEILKNRIIAYHMSNGVRFDDPSSAFIGCDVTIGAGARIGASTELRGKTSIASGATIKSGCSIEDCVIDGGAVVDASHLNGAYIGRDSTVGPYAYIRPGSIVGSGCRIGDFVELKNCIIGDGSKVAHLSYVGDCEIGKECNIGCGVVFVNYDGKDKHRTRVGDRVFIGSNTNVIAPLVIADGAYIAAGSTLTDAVPPHALAIARARQVNKPDWKGNKFSPYPQEKKEE